MSLADLSDGSGRFRVLAVDHRDSLRAFLRPDDPDSVAAAELIAIKRALVETVSPHATGVMLEPEYSIPQVLDVLAPGVGFLAALESQGYLADPTAAPTSLYWSVAEAAASGAAALKLLLPYHPDHALAAAQRAVAADVIAEARSVGAVVVLEPLFHSLASPDDRTRVVMTTVEDFADTGADLLKLPFPSDPDSDRDDWAEACARITERCQQPWAILSGGGTFESFAAQVEAAVAAGCSGFMVGRALWGEAAHADAGERGRIIDELVLPRWESLAALV